MNQLPRIDKDTAKRWLVIICGIFVLVYLSRYLFGM